MPREPIYSDPNFTDPKKSPPKAAPDEPHHAEHDWTWDKKLKCWTRPLTDAERELLGFVESDA